MERKRMQISYLLSQMGHIFLGLVVKKGEEFVCRGYFERTVVLNYHIVREFLSQ